MKPFAVTEWIVFWCFFTVKIRTNIFSSACWKVYDAAAEYLWPEDSQLLEGSVKDKIYADKLAVQEVEAKAPTVVGSMDCEQLGPIIMSASHVAP